MTNPLRPSFQPFASPRRLGLVLLAWVALAGVHALLLGLALRKIGAVGGAALFYVPRAVAWAALTPLIAGVDAWLRARRPSAPSALATHVAALVAVGVADTIVRRGIIVALGERSMVPWSATLLYYADWTVVGYLVVVVAARTVAAHDAFVARERQTLALEA